MNFVILNELLGEEESLPLKVRDKVVKLMADFIYDSSNEHARFFTAFRMTFPGGFCHSERAFGRGRIPTVKVRDKVVKLMADFIYDSPNEYARFFTIVQNDMPGGFPAMSTQDSSLSFRMTFPGGFCHSERVPPFFVILNELLGEEESLPLKVRDKVVKLMADFIYDSSNEHARFFTAFRMTCREDFLQ